MNAIGKTILKYRKRKEMNQEDICRAMSVDLKTVSAWERSRSIPDGETLRKLSDILEFPIEEIISETSREAEKQKKYNIALLCISAISLLFTAVMLMRPYIQKLIVDRENELNGCYGMPVDTTIVELIATPEKYHGKLIRVVGVGNLEFEGDYISLSKEDWQYHGDHQIWIDLGDIGISYEEAQAYNGKYVILEGVFNMNNPGHMSIFQGAIENVSRYDLWFTEESWYNDQTNDTDKETNE